MKKRRFLELILAAVVGAALLAAIVVRAFLPRVILPRLDAQAVAALSLLALVIDFYTAKSARDYRILPLCAAFVFGVFPLAGGFVSPTDAAWLSLLGAVVFTAATFLFDSLVERLSTSPAAKIAPIAGALALWLAAGCLAGIV